MSLMSGNKKLRVLHLAGAADTEFYAQLSRFSGHDCCVALEDKVRDGMEFVYAYVHPIWSSEKDTNGGQVDLACARSDLINKALWSFPTDLSDDSIQRDVKHNKLVSVQHAKQVLSSMNVDICLNHMFDLAGTTVYRDLLTELNIPFSGSDSRAMEISNDKKKFRDLAIKYGNGMVSVPKGASISKKVFESKYNNLKDRFSVKSFEYDLLQNNGVKYPIIVKPSSQDNSLGVSYIANTNELRAKLLNAFDYAYDGEILIEQYIPLGRELRVGIVEIEPFMKAQFKDVINYAQQRSECNTLVQNDKYIMLPVIEYYLDNELHPIRDTNDKLDLDNESKTPSFVSQRTKYTSKVNCEMNDKKLLNKMFEMCVKAHKLMKCNDFSIFDIRVDKNNVPYIIEANLFCCFATCAIIVTMAESSKNPFLTQEMVFRKMISQAVNRNNKSGNGLQFKSKL